MSSGEDRTQNWLLANMGHTDMESDNDPGIPCDIHSLSTSDEPNVLFETNLQSDDDSLRSWELNRISPGPCLDDDEDTGPPSIETQAPDSAEQLETSRMTSEWINSGKHFATVDVGSEDFGCDVNCSRDQVINNQMAELHYSALGHDSQATGSGVKTCLEATLPTAPLNSPVHLNSPVLSGDTPDNEALSGICGLRNLGNTCFMAAGIQCLVNTPPIAQYFFSHRPDDDEIANRYSLAASFSQLIHKIWSGKFSCLRPFEFKDAFGQYFKDFRDYRQHDCQEFLTLLLEALRKQMPLTLNESFQTLIHEAIEMRNGSSDMASGHAESHMSTSSTPPQSPLSAGSVKGEHGMDIQESSVPSCYPDVVGIDSGAASPKSSISSSSVDAHLISLRLRPIPEEVKHMAASKANSFGDDVSYSGTISCHDGESITSDLSDSGEMGSALSGMGSGSVRQYNTLSVSYDSCDYNACDNTLLADNADSPDVLDNPCDTSSFLHLQKMDAFSPLSPASNSTANVSMVKIEDIIKESKTSNVNVLVTDNPANNKIIFDSEKYAKFDDRRLKKNLDNLVRSSGVKRGKEVNLIVNKLDNSQLNTSPTSSVFNSKANDSLHKRIRLDEKNVQYEKAKTHVDRLDISDDVQSSDEQIANNSEHNRLANEDWIAFTENGKSAVVNTFYGQFKSSLVCSVCNHTSIRFDPFSTLSVPLPNANEIQITVIFIQPDSISPIKCLLTLCKVSSVEDMVTELLKILHINTKADIVFAEVFDNHIAKILDESVKTKFLNHPARSIYAFDMLPAPVSAEEDVNQERASEEDEMVDQSNGDGNTASGSASNVVLVYRTCNICLEEFCCTELKTHENCDDCMLCDGCVNMSCGHHGSDTFPCPVCQSSLTPAMLIPVDHRKTGIAKARIMRIPVVCRIDTESSDNNKREMQLFGHPFLLNLPSRIKATRLLNLIKRRLKQCNKFQLLLVEGRGYNCSRCLFASHCHGCDALKAPIVVFNAGDSLCIRFTNVSTEQILPVDSPLEHESLANLRQKKPLTLYDCFRQFSQSETLEDSESWYCPKCAKKQEATKAISIQRYPRFLIVHLERFLFHGTLSTKVDDRVVFPLDGLDLSDFVSGSQSSLLYSLYGCVCHVGVADAGHYTAVVKSPFSGDWHCFNDSSVSRQRPGEEEFSTAYILFYHQKAVKFDLNLPLSFSYAESGARKANENLYTTSNDDGYNYASQEDQPVMTCSPRPRCSPSNVPYEVWGESAESESPPKDYAHGTADDTPPSSEEMTDYADDHLYNLNTFPSSPLLDVLPKEKYSRDLNDSHRKTLASFQSVFSDLKPDHILKNSQPETYPRYSNLFPELKYRCDLNANICMHPYKGILYSPSFS